MESGWKLDIDDKVGNGFVIVLDAGESKLILPQEGVYEMTSAGAKKFGEDLSKEFGIPKIKRKK